MRRPPLPHTLTFLALAAAASLPASQWIMFGGNPQRDGWARDETILTRDNVKSMKLQWKVHVDNALKEMNSLTAPIVAENVLTAQGHKDIVVVAGASDTLDAINIDNGKILWHKRFIATIWVHRTIEGSKRHNPGTSSRCAQG